MSECHMDMSLETRQKMREAKLKNPTRYWLGKKRDVDTIAKSSKALKGKIPWNKGVATPEETRQKIRAGRRANPTVPWNKGKKLPPISLEHKEKLHASTRGKPAWNRGISPSEETIEKRRKANTGRKVSDETRIKISVAQKGKSRPNTQGEKHPNWKGGISKEPYAFDFTRELRKQIKERDNYTCQLCGKIDNSRNGRFLVHHINYCKTDSSQHNLITLCHSCHSKTNGDREFYSIILKPLTYTLIGEVCV